ncbi:MAG: hypothetical protein IJY50_01610 [Clostridia bacterium]|nr:hypothetical protein [Clostridia bacterium]
MKNRKLMIVLIVALTLAVLAACLGTFVHITKGEVEEKDGIKQNSRIYLDNVRYEDGKIYYTVVNKTCRQVTWGGFKLDGIHKYENGKWTPLTIDGGDADIGRILKPFQQSGELYYDRPYLAPGDYRIILTSNDFAMVGYLTVT